MSFPPVSNETRLQCEAGLANFLDGGAIEEEEARASISFHEARFTVSKGQGDHLSIPELVERIRLAEKAQNTLTKEKGNNPTATLPPLEFNMAHLAYFIYADKEFLESMVEDTALLIDYRLRNVEPFISMVLQKLKDTPLHLSSPAILTEDNASDYQSSPPYQPSVRDVGGDQTIDRNSHEAEQARRRDQHCIATHCSEIQVCHIMPFSLNSKASKLTTVTRIFQSLFLPMMPLAEWKKMRDLLFPSTGELGTSDRAWNMLSMNPLAHAIWNKGRFALEWIGIDELNSGPYKKVLLRWHWLPDRVAEALGQNYLHEKSADKGDTGRLIKFGSELCHGMATAIKECLDSTSKISSHGISLTRMSNFRPIVSGNLLKINVKEDDLDKTRLVVELQWFALRMVAFSGAAEVADKLDSEPPRYLQQLPTWFDPRNYDIYFY